jgi:hypothetical protein
LFHHRTSFAKFPASPIGADPRHLPGPLTHVSTPISSLQGDIWQAQDGLTEAQVRVVRCGKGGDCERCSLRHLVKVDICLQRSSENKHVDPLPITLVAVPAASYVHTVSARAARAYTLLGEAGQT